MSGGSLLVVDSREILRFLRADQRPVVGVLAYLVLVGEI
jgi:hypothetical protein